MLRRVLCVGLVLLMLAGCVSTLSGCTSKNKEEVTTIHWYMRKPVSDMSRQNEVEAAANEIIYNKLGVKLKFHFIEQAAWSDKVNVMMSTGSDFDIITTASTEFINNAKKNSFAPLGKTLDMNAPSIKSKVDDFAWDAVTFNDEIMGIPSQTFYVPYSAFAFKKDLVEKYNFDYKDASTYEAIEPFLKKVKDNEPGIIPMVATMNGGVSAPKTGNYCETTLDFLYYDIDKGQFSVPYFIDEIKSGYKTLYDFKQKGYISSEAISKNEPVSEMKSGKYAVINGRRSAEKSSNLYGFECVEATPTYGVISTLNVLNSVNAISAKSKHIDDAVKLLNLIWEDSYLSNTLAYGIEGKDYTVDKGDIHNYSDINEIHITTNSGTNVKWSIWHNWLGPLWEQWDSPWNSRESLEKMKELNETAEVSPVLGFIIDTSKIKTEVAQLTSVYNDAGQILTTGAMKDFDAYYSELEQKFKNAGIDKVIAEAERQYKATK